MEIVNCPNCKGRGRIEYTNALNFGAIGALTFGLLNFFDKIFTQEWSEECERCDGLGKIKAKVKEE